jgi:hypothetical protein
VYAPLAIYQLTGLIAVIAVVEVVSPPRARAVLAIGFGGLLALAALFWVAVLTWVRAALREGVATTAQVIGVRSFPARVRLVVNGKEMRMIAREAPRLRPGDLVLLLVNRNRSRILISLGRPKAEVG